MNGSHSPRLICACLGVTMMILLRAAPAHAGRRLRHRRIRRLLGLVRLRLRLTRRGRGEFLVAGLAGGGGEYGLFGNTSSALTVLSFNGVVYPLKIEAAVTPFVTGGYSRFSSGEGVFNTFNLGAGVNFWQNEHAGVRVEFRDHVRRDVRGTVHYFSIRTGVGIK